MVVNQPHFAGPFPVVFPVPADAVEGTTYARFRLSSNGNLLATGVASDGEVEDYEVAVSPMANIFSTVRRIDTPLENQAASFRLLLGPKQREVLEAAGNDLDRVVQPAEQQQGVTAGVVDVSASAFLNPHRPECGFAYKGLCSAGLAFSLGAALRAEMGAKLDLRGWLDLVVLREAAIVNGFTSLAMNKLDVLSGISELKVCVAYEGDDGRRYDLRTPNITIYPDREYAETDQNVMITTHAGRTKAVGLQGSLDKGLLKMFSSDEQRVHTIILPHQFK